MRFGTLSGRLVLVREHAALDVGEASGGRFPAEFADRDDIGFECWLNDERVQRGRTAEMIFGVDDLVARLSRVCRLLPGDLIFTGTPAGVGNRRNPPRYLADGDVLVSRFERIGEIRQSFAR